MLHKIFIKGLMKCSGGRLYFNLKPDVFSPVKKYPFLFKSQNNVWSKCCLSINCLSKICYVYKVSVDNMSQPPNKQKFVILYYSNIPLITDGLYSSKKHKLHLCLSCSAKKFLVKWAT
jgi:hypothetical protein